MMKKNNHNHRKELGIIGSVILEQFATTKNPSQQKIAEELGISTRTVSNHVARLKKAGHLIVTRRGAGKAAQYKLAV